MRGNMFGRHLYNQIVMPLVLAAVVVGVIATLVAVFFLSGPTDRWINQVAEGATENLESRFDAQAGNMIQVAKLAAEDVRLKSALEEGDLQKARGLVTQIAIALSLDNLMVLDEAGRVVASTGTAAISIGDQPFGESELSYVDLKMSHSSLLNLDSQLSITAFNPVIAGETVYTLAVSKFVTHEFLSGITGGTGEAFAFFDESGERVAVATSEGTGGDLKAVTNLRLALDEQSDVFVRAIAEAARGEIGHADLEAEDARYRVVTRKLTLTDDPSGSFGYAATVVSQSVTDEARRTTTNLIMVWSVFAVLALVGLGGWVARRVSDPLVELTEAARRVADGDFSTKMTIAGTNEISELAASFNTMTESLQERSESLTKKVLELATLYEMSRALGSTLEMDTLLDSVLESALRIFGVELGYVVLRDRETDRLELRVSRGADGETDDLALRSSMSEWVVREGRPLIFNPTRGDSERRVDIVTGALAALCVPLTSPEGTVGSITVGSRDPEFRFSSDDVRLLSTIGNHVTIAIGNIELFSSLQDAYLSTVRSLAAAVDAKDPFTRGHSDRVETYATLIAEKLGLSHEQRIALEMAAYLHDIGKIGVKEEILLKPGRLTDFEMGQMKHHPLIGANILKPVGFPWPITPIVRHHHERWDGMGYPAGLKGEEIPLLARILTVADAFEAMIADRPYRPGRTIEDAIEELEHCAGSQFDPKIVQQFVTVIRESLSDELEHDEDLDDPQPEEAEAIFVALCDGMFSSFRRLGGPRLASNVEAELNNYFVEEDLPFAVLGGRMTVSPNGDGSDESRLDAMRTALSHIDVVMGMTSGHSLVDHFYVDALESLSGRMRRIASRLDFYSE